MKVVVKTLTGDEITITGDVVDSLITYFSVAGERPSIGWVANGNAAVNFNHVVHVRFIQEEVNA